MTHEWWAGIPSATLRIDCGPSAHTLAWADGRLHVVDHPEVERERALIALGGQPAPCLDVLDAWERHRADLAVLAVAPREPSDRIWVPGHAEAGLGTVSARIAAIAPETVGQVGPTSHGPRGRGRKGRPVHRPEQEGDELIRLLRLGGGIPARLVATVIAEWCSRVERGDESVASAVPALRAAVYGRLRAVLRDRLPPGRTVEVELAEPGAAPSFESEPDAWRFTLPFSWLRDVWARDLATVFGRLCLSAEPVGLDEWRLVTVDPDLGGARTMRVTLA